MRIALDATYSIDPHPSGIAVYSKELLNGLAASHPSDQFLHCFRWKQWKHAKEPTPANARRKLLLPPLKTFGADLFHALNQRVDRRPVKRVVVTFHDLFVLTADYSSPAFRKRFRLQAEQAAQNADLILAVSQFTAGQVHELLHVPHSHIRVVPHGVYPAPETPPSMESREKIVLFVGALQLRKNVKRLVRAFASLPSDWRLVLAGAPDGYGAEKIIQAVEQSPARTRIEIMGYVKPAQLSGLYRRSSLFAFPSLDEGFGIPILEAMSYGLPVLTSSCSAMPEVAGNAALLVDPEREEAIAQSLQRLATDIELRNQLSDLGQKRAQLFTWRQTCEKTYQAYFELLKQNPRQGEGQSVPEQPRTPPNRNVLSDLLRSKSSTPSEISDLGS